MKFVSNRITYSQKLKEFWSLKVSIITSDFFNQRDIRTTFDNCGLEKQFLDTTEDKGDLGGQPPLNFL